MLCFSHQHHTFLRELVERVYPNEACGILLGLRHDLDDRDEVVRVIPCANVDPEPQRRYSIAPADLIAAQKQAREEGLRIVGFFHSHPDHPAEASPSDLREAHWTGCTYMICSVERGTLVHVSAQRLTASNQWEPIQLYFAPPEDAPTKT